MEPVAVVIPVLDEAASIARVVRELPRAVVREAIVVDGGSTDGTPAVAAAAGARVIDPGQMRVVRAGLRILEPPLPHRRRAGEQSKVAGSLQGTLRAASLIFATFPRVATARP